jgi:SAM-dependent methyltransferase
VLDGEQEPDQAGIGARSLDDVRPTVDAVRALVDHCEFTGAMVADALDVPAERDYIVNAGSLAVALPTIAELGIRDRTRVAVELFLLNRPVESTLARAVLGAGLLARLVEADVLRCRGNSLAATISLTPYGRHVFLSDQLFTSRGALDIVMDTRRELCMPPHYSSLLTLARVPSKLGVLLDIGCGSGFLAITLAGQSEEVVGVDLNPRAVRFARLNAALNRVPASFRLADFRDLDELGRGFTDVVFNAPTLPDSGVAADAEFGRMPASRALSDIASLLLTQTSPAVTAIVNVLIEVPEDFPSAASVVLHCLSGSGLASIRTIELNAREFALSKEHIRDGKPPGRSFLFASPDGARRALNGLRRRRTSALVPAVVELRK